MPSRTQQVRASPGRIRERPTRQLLRRPDPGRRQRRLRGCVPRGRARAAVGLIEKDKLGGTCLHRGCIPTKALLHAGEVADAAREARAVRRPGDLRRRRHDRRSTYKDGVVNRLYKGLQGLVEGAAR